MVQRANPIRIFVYGTLRRGEPYHHLMSACEYLGTRKTLPKYELVNIGHYPGLLSRGNTAVTGDLYLVDSETLDKLDEYEGYPEDYSREYVDLVGSEQAVAYMYRLNTDDCSIISSGDWKKR